MKRMVGTNDALRLNDATSTADTSAKSTTSNPTTTSADTMAGDSTTMMSGSSTTMTGTSGSPRLVSVDQFATAVSTPGVVTINVHTPHEADIPGTDLVIGYDVIATSTDLPAAKTTPLAVYCRSGNMSATAVKDLQAKGYVNIIELRGGYDAWLQAGRTLESP